MLLYVVVGAVASLLFFVYVFDRFGKRFDKS